MRVTMIGTGYVGLVSGACFADFGHTVTCVDKDAGKIARLQKGEIPIFEPGLDELVKDNVEQGRLFFTTDPSTAIRDADAVFRLTAATMRNTLDAMDVTDRRAALMHFLDGASEDEIEDFKAAIARGESRFSRLLQESHAYRWRSVTPARVYYGGIDEVTPVFIGTLPVGYQKVIGGAEVTAVDAGPKADHRGTFLYSIADQKQWFDQLLEKTPV